MLGADGPYRTTGCVVPAAHAAGAGDTFVSAMTLALASGAGLRAAMDLAAAADLILAREGTATCGGDELGRELAGQGKFLRDAIQIRQSAGRLRQEGRRVVFTNGCFDILHRGRITYLERAKALGDVLIVDLNDDDSARRLKGAGRPLNPLADRIAVVAALGCVDHVLAFAGDTAHGPIEMVRPDVFAKGGDYAAKTLPEVALVEALGGRVRLRVHGRPFDQRPHRAHSQGREDRLGDVLIPTYNRPAALAVTLASLPAQELPLRVVVSDQGDVAGLVDRGGAGHRPGARGRGALPGLASPPAAPRARRTARLPARAGAPPPRPVPRR